MTPLVEICRADQVTATYQTPVFHHYRVRIDRRQSTARTTSATMRSRSAVTVTSGANRRPPLGEAARSSMARSTSPSPWIWATIGSTASAGATLSNFLLEKASRCGLSGLKIKLTRETFGAICLSSSRNFPMMDSSSSGNPVMFSPECAQARHVSAQRIASSRHDDRNRARHLLEDWDDAAADGDDGVRLALAQACGIAAHHFHVVRSPPLIKLNFCCPSIHPSPCISCLNARTRACMSGSFSG